MIRLYVALHSPRVCVQKATLSYIALKSNLAMKLKMPRKAQTFVSVVCLQPLAL